MRGNLLSMRDERWADLHLHFTPDPPILILQHCSSSTLQDFEDHGPLENSAPLEYSTPSQEDSKMLFCRGMGRKASNLLVLVACSFNYCC